MSIAGAWEFVPAIHHDERGTFAETYTADALATASGLSFELAQVNTSVSRRGVIRGVHAVRASPGQAKYVMCVAGEILDVVVDLRPQSETFGRWQGVVLDDRSRHALFIPAGLGHAFQVLSAQATVVYATDSAYDPGAELSVNPLDPDLAITWRDLGPPILSPRDARAPQLVDIAHRLP